ncbi:MAG: secondary thiamine-phosphate synthase enzyme YjbQ [Deltaproteobacteria bacterium]|nr:secondary thiamine-phosphate synthase enzyme YjbQ [Deltaproteobacteria bacterium]
MKIVTSELPFKTTGQTDIIDITREVQEEVLQSGIQDGNMALFIPGSTAALTTIEFESGVVNDLRKAIERLAPKDIPYEHDRRWGDGNGYSHVRAAILGPSLIIPIRGGKVLLGTWQQIVLLDFDNRPRRRRVTVQIMGNEGG